MDYIEILNSKIQKSIGEIFISSDHMKRKVRFKSCQKTGNYL